MTALPAETGSVDPVADANARRKAKLIAEFAWRLGISFDELGTLPYSDKTDRRRPTLRRFAASAFRAAGVDENVPHSRTSDTWRHLRGELVELADRARFGFDPPPAPDLLEQRGQWIPDEQPAVEVPPAEEARALAAVADPPRVRRLRPVELAPYAPDEAPALVTSGCPALLAGSTTDPPRGWLELAQLGPLPGRSCRWCGGPAIVGTPNGWRCGEHWPVPGDPRGDWGWALNWTPKAGKAPCLRAVCYCGRCAHYDVTCQPLQSLRGGQ